MNPNLPNNNCKPLSGEDIWNYLLSKRLTVMPLMDKSQVGIASLDIRLGNEFVVMRKTNFPGIDIGKYQKMRKEIHQYQERVRIDYGEQFVLHPNEFVLGSTLEYISLPTNIFAFVLGRSSWGRLGIVIATATFVDPGFTGTITLELANLGDLPLTLYPCLRIGHLIFFELGKDVEGYKGSYGFTCGPKFSEVYKDTDLDRIILPREEVSADQKPGFFEKSSADVYFDEESTKVGFLPNQLNHFQGKSLFRKTIDFIAKR